MEQKINELRQSSQKAVYDKDEQIDKLTKD